MGTLIPLYYGDPAEAAALACQANAISASSQAAPIAAMALAQTIESLALSQIGDDEGSRAMLIQANEVVGALDSTHQTDSVFGFSERRWYFYQGRILTHLGEFESAWAAQEQALSLYPAERTLPKVREFRDLVSTLREEMPALDQS